jgi:hypothetical protein
MRFRFFKNLPKIDTESHRIQKGGGFKVGLFNCGEFWGNFGEVFLYSVGDKFSNTYSIVGILRIWDGVLPYKKWSRDGFCQKTDPNKERNPIKSTGKTQIAWRRDGFYPKMDAKKERYPIF